MLVCQYWLSRATAGQTAADTVRQCLEGGEDVLHEIFNQLFHVCQPVISLSTSASTSFQWTLKDDPRVSCWVTWSNQLSLHLFTFGEKGFWGPTRGVTMLRTKSLCVLCWRFGAVFSDTWCGMSVFSWFSNHNHISQPHSRSGGTLTDCTWQ